MLHTSFWSQTYLGYPGIFSSPRVSNQCNIQEIHFLKRSNIFINVRYIKKKKKSYGLTTQFQKINKTKNLLHIFPVLEAERHWLHHTHEWREAEINHKRKIQYTNEWSKGRRVLSNFISVLGQKRCTWVKENLHGSNVFAVLVMNHGPSQQSSKEEYKPWKRGAIARYYTSHTKTMLPTRKSVPRSSRQSDHKNISWPS